MKGSLEVIVGSMFSGKTHELIRRLRLCAIAKKKVQVFKSNKDNRYKPKALVSHDGFELPSFAVSDSSEIFEMVEGDCAVVGVDEAQFLDTGLILVCEMLAHRGIRVIVAGLDLDWRGEPFEIMSELTARAEKVTKNLAICSVCGEEAHYTQRLSASLERVVVGATELYEARCRNCFKAPPKEVFVSGDLELTKRAPRHLSLQN